MVSVHNWNFVWWHSYPNRWVYVVLGFTCVCAVTVLLTELFEEEDAIPFRFDQNEMQDLFSHDTSLTRNPAPTSMSHSNASDLLNPPAQEQTTTNRHEKPEAETTKHIATDSTVRSVKFSLMPKILGEANVVLNSAETSYLHANSRVLLLRILQELERIRQQFIESAAEQHAAKKRLIEGSSEVGEHMKIVAVQTARADYYASKILSVKRISGQLSALVSFRLAESTKAENFWVRKGEWIGNCLVNFIRFHQRSLQCWPIHTLHSPHSKIGKDIQSGQPTIEIISEVWRSW